MSAPHHVVIVGGGFGGLYAARSLRRAPVRVTLIDRRNFHLFQPLLYQVATGGLSPANIAAPLRGILSRQRNTRVLLGEVTGVDADRRVVRMGREEITYDTLIVATGVRHDYFGKDRWEADAPGLKTIEDATEIRRRILAAFEEAEREGAGASLTFVVVGGGPTGVEMAGALGEIARDTLARDFRSINPADAQIILLEAGERVLSSYPPVLSEKAAAALAALGVSVRTGTLVIDVTGKGVAVRAGGKEEFIAARTTLWAAGIRASPLGRALAEATGVPLDGAGRVSVAPDLSLPGRPEIFVIGDLAHFSHQAGAPLPGTAPVAMQQGRYVAELVRRRLMNRPVRPFRYRDRGSMATIGRSAAVADLGGLRVSGFFAWLLWLFVHLIYLIQFESRMLVLVQWAWNYFTYNRSARLITGGDDRR